MKTRAVLLLFLLPAVIQAQEFKSYATGLMYDDATMRQLDHIVDSLNLAFTVCDLDKPFNSLPITTGHYIAYEGSGVDSMIKDFENQISFEEFEKKYQVKSLRKNLLFAAHSYTDHEGDEVVTIEGHPADFDLDLTIGLARFDSITPGSWVYKSYKKSSYSEASIYAMFITTAFQTNNIPYKYARMIQYSECLIDTSQQVLMNPDRQNASWREQPEGVSSFIEYVHQQTNYPKPGKDYEKYWKELQTWDSLKFITLDKIKSSEKFREKLKEALKAVRENNYSNDELEEYIARYHSKTIALELKRSRRVIGGCSMDQAPREHARNIAILAAESATWEVFLRAHLDIMNDRFDRMSDGSYAWEGRQTYIGELEALNINVTDLLLGISLRIENPARNHYFGSVGRIGRALSESKNKNQIENQMLEMMSDKDLDLYNRMIIYYLFTSYNHHITDESRKTANTTRMKLAVQTFPEHLSEKMN